MGNSVKPLNSDEQRNLRNKAKAELERLEAVYSDEPVREKIDKFKNLFSACEIVYKVILEDHQFNKTGEHPTRMVISMKQAPYALSYAGYDYERDLLANLFGAEDRVGRRSVKKIRDLLNHSVNQSVVKELMDREAELFGYMNSFLNKIRYYDYVAKSREIPTPAAKQCLLLDN